MLFLKELNYICNPIFHYRQTKTIVVLGETGVGKSAMCNRFIGDSPHSQTFRVSAITSGRTTETKVMTAFFGGNLSRPFRIVDTQGFNEPGTPDNPDSSFNLKIMNDIMKKLTEVDQVDIFLICRQQISNRITNSLIYMLNYFKDIFGHKMSEEGTCQDPDVFWDHCIIAFTKVKMDQTSREDRLFQNRVTDEELATHCIKDLVKYLSIHQPFLNYVFIDSFYKEHIKDEQTTFSLQTEKLYKILSSNSPAMTKAMLLAYDKLGKGKHFQSGSLSSSKRLSNLKISDY